MSVVWFNGEFVQRLSVDADERGLMLGDGIFETIAVRNGRTVWLKEHLNRMAQASVELGIGFDRKKIERAVAEVLIKSHAAAEVLRITLTRGPTARGLSAEGQTPSLILSLNPFDRSALPKHTRLATSKIRRNQTAPSSRLKTLSYIDEIQAAREVSHLADDALMLNTMGHVASTTIANIFLVKGNLLITPADNQGILQGIARKKLLEATHLIVESRVVETQELTQADCVFLTNSLRLATPVSEIDGKLCGTRDIGFIHSYYEQISNGD
jgi:branched-chain amino acid aminotransferase